MTHQESVDVAIIGAGPAGCCAAIRLLALGHRVAVIERTPFPRPQIGESLSAGIWNILDYLGAPHSFKTTNFLQDVPTRVIWDQQTPKLVPTQQHRPGVTVDRAEFDTWLLGLATKAGTLLFQPAHLQSIDKKPNAWQLYVVSPQQTVTLRARLILHARGRSGTARDRFPLATKTIALWTSIAGNTMPHETQIEAIHRGWLWGTSLLNGQYRVMAFMDLCAPQKKGHGFEYLFRKMVAESTLFGRAATATFLSPVRTCSATPYFDTQSWSPGAMKLGENALALDPLSSSGVEKSMRLALQAVVAANTLLRAPNSAELAKEYYESSLLSSAATHILWTCDYYRSAWPGSHWSFWRDRSQGLEEMHLEQPAILRRLHEAYTKQQRLKVVPGTTANVQLENEPLVPEILGTLLKAPVRLSADVSFVEVPCVVNDFIQLHPAVTHPRLDRPLAFLVGYQLVPLLQVARTVKNLGQLIALWSTWMPVRIAAHVAGWLRQHGLIEIEKSV